MTEATDNGKQTGLRALKFVAVIVAIGGGLYLYEGHETRATQDLTARTNEVIPEPVKRAYSEWIPLTLGSMFRDDGAQVEVIDPLLGSFTASKTAAYELDCSVGTVMVKIGDRQVMVFGPGLSNAAPAIEVHPASPASAKITKAVCDATRDRLGWIFQ